MKTLVAILPLLILTACSGNTAPPATAEGAEHIACALGGDQTFKPVCAVERAQSEGKLVLIVRHPDGAFRRFDVLGGGQGLALSDGAETAQVAMAGTDLEVAVRLDKYRFPVTAKGDAASK
jgi:hypothetical protein